MIPLEQTSAVGLQPLWSTHWLLDLIEHHKHDVRFFINAIGDRSMKDNSRGWKNWWDLPSRGETTIVIPRYIVMRSRTQLGFNFRICTLSANAGTWKHMLFPMPVGANTRTSAPIKKNSHLWWEQTVQITWDSGFNYCFLFSSVLRISKSCMTLVRFSDYESWTSSILCFKTLRTHRHDFQKSITPWLTGHNQLSRLTPSLVSGVWPSYQYRQDWDK